MRGHPSPRTVGPRRRPRCSRRHVPVVVFVLGGMLSRAFAADPPAIVPSTPVSIGEPRSAYVGGMPALHRSVAVAASEPAIEPERTAPVVSSALDELFVLVMDEPSFVEIGQAVRLSADQFEFARQAFAAYQADIGRFRVSIGDMIEPAIADFLARAAGPEQPGPADLSTLAGVLDEALRSLRRGIESANAALEVRVRECLDDSQVPLLDRALRAWRRALLLNEGRSDDPVRARQDLGLHVDLFKLAVDAADADASLRPWLRLPRLVESAPVLTAPDPRAADGSSNADRVAADAVPRHPDIEIVLDAYAERLDVLLVEAAWKRADEHLKRVRATVDRDAAALERVQRASLRRWAAIHRLTDEYARAVADRIGAIGGDEAAARAWMDAYRRALFPRLHEPRSADVVWDWIRSLPADEVPADRRAILASAWSEHVERRRTLRRRMQQAFIACVTQDGMRPGMVDFRRRIGDEPERLRPITVERRALNDAFLEFVRTVIPVTRHADMDRILAEARREGHDGEPLEF